MALGDYAGLVLAVVDSHRPLDLNNIQEQDEDSPFEVWTLCSFSFDAAPPRRLVDGQCNLLDRACLKSHAVCTRSRTAVHSRLW